MKKTKKIAAILMVMVLTMCFSLPVAAISITTDPGEGSTLLTYAVAQTFTVTIPASVTISGEEKSGTGSIAVSNSIIPYGKALNVTITDAANYEGGEFRLKDGANNNFIKYTVTKSNSDSVQKDTAFLSVAAGTQTGSETLTFIAENPTKAGTFTDTLTFTVAVADM